MSGTTYHPEDIRAALRKRHGTVGSFAKARSLKAQAIADWLRGRTSAPVAKAIADELGVEEVQLSISVDNSAADAPAHRINAGGK